MDSPYPFPLASAVAKICSGCKNEKLPYSYLHEIEADVAFTCKSTHF